MRYVILQVLSATERAPTYDGYGVFVIGLQGKPTLIGEPLADSVEAHAAAPELIRKWTAEQDRKRYDI
jgi:hypothetical protein